MSDIIKKAEKIASALYLVTSFFDDQEPLRWKLRSLSLDLISNKVKDKTNTAREITSHLSLARSTNLVSETNHHILLRELSKFEGEVESHLNSTFFREEAPVERLLPQFQKFEPIKDKITEILADKPVRTEEKPALREFGAVSLKKNSRQSIIINLLKRKKEIMIKDVSPLISGCSEKTIQRELLAMVRAGILKKTGEKRWSRYSLA
jgi:hypothetical protein